MQAPEPYETTYQHDRRKSRHRCRCCWKIIEAGEPVLMVRLNRRTWAVHLPCADEKNIGDWTWRDTFEAHARIHARNLGYRVDRHPMEKSSLSESAKPTEAP